MRRKPYHGPISNAHPTPRAYALAHPAADVRSKAGGGAGRGRGRGRGGRRGVSGGGSAAGGRGGAALLGRARSSLRPARPRASSHPRPQGCPACRLPPALHLPPRAALCLQHPDVCKSQRRRLSRPCAAVCITSRRPSSCLITDAPPLGRTAALPLLPSVRTVQLLLLLFLLLLLLLLLVVVVVLPRNDQQCDRDSSLTSVLLINAIKALPQPPPSHPNPLLILLDEFLRCYGYHDATFMNVEGMWMSWFRLSARIVSGPHTPGRTTTRIGLQCGLCNSQLAIRNAAWSWVVDRSLLPSAPKETLKEKE